MVVVGITGGIGCGKSTVAALLAGRGAVVIDADQMARQVAAPGGAAYPALVEHFGPAMVRPDGTLDRGAIAARAFADAEELATLNAITHPAIAAATLTRLAALAALAAPESPESPEADPGQLVVLEIPLLSEGAKQLYRLAGVVVVDAPVEVAVRRLVDQRGLTESDARARIRAQPSREERLAMADVVVDNGGSREDLEASVARLWGWLTDLTALTGAVGSESVDGPAEEPADADGHEHHEEDH